MGIDAVRFFAYDVFTTSRSQMERTASKNWELPFFFGKRLNETRRSNTFGKGRHRSGDRFDRSGDLFPVLIGCDGEMVDRGLRLGANHLF